MARTTKSMVRLCLDVKREIKKHKIAPNESYDHILRRFFGLKKKSKLFSFKNIKNEIK